MHCHLEFGPHPFHQQVVIYSCFFFISYFAQLNGCTSLFVHVLCVFFKYIYFSVVDLEQMLEINHWL